MATNVVEFVGVDKEFGRTQALNGFSMEVAQGDVHGFLGPNGAGKTTAIRVLLGMYQQTKGHVSLFGEDPWHHATRLHRRLAYVPGDVALWPQLRGSEALAVLASMQGSMNQARQTQLIERFDLDVRKPCHTYSKGNRQKVALIAALSADVDLLILDEPTSGLDPLMEIVFREAVQEAVQRGTTVLLSSHILSEVEQLCNQVTIVRAGQRILHGSLADLRAVATSQVIATLDPVDVNIPGVTDVQWQGRTLRCQVTNQAMAELMARVAAHGVQQLTVQPPTLEQIFMEHYQPTQECVS
ncbi:MAG: ATP-binding cassette domain-containing protein [Roseiflexaceae bacterium]